jgi:hypothetical protein
MLRLLDSATQLRDATGYDFGSHSGGAKPSYGEESIVGVWRP